MNFESIELSSICRTNAYSYSQNDNWQFVNYLDTGNITQNKISEIQHIDLQSEKLPSRAKRKVKHDSILFSTVRPNQLHYGIIKSQPENFLVSTGFAVIDIDETKAVADFIYYYLIQKDIIQHLQAIAEQSTSAYPSIKPSDIENLIINIPDLKTQSRIAAILSALDDKIELNNKINENLEQQLVCLYNAIFKNNTQYCELGSVVDTTSGGTPSRKKDEYYKNGSICWVKSKELTGTYLIDTEEKITEVGLSSSSAKIIPSNSTLIAMYGATVGEYGIISKPMTCNQAVCALIPNENFPFTVVFMFAMSNKNNLINLAIGSAQQNISQILIMQMKICCDLSLNKRFHGIAEPIFEKIKEIVVENARLSALRDTLLPKLMNGEIDVSEVKI
ncbi:MAG: hypothetical protein HDR33_02985 [Treponema sp.]|nr:hypothetical protein [Treponema sp.]